MYQSTDKGTCTVGFGVSVVCVWLSGNAPSNHSPAFRGSPHAKVQHTSKEEVGSIAFGAVAPPRRPLGEVGCARDALQ